jgi:ACS family D-galactonate transporter-like MFS transporter
MPIISGLLISSSILGANFVQSPALIIACLSIAFFGNGLASITWSMVSAIAPERLLGLTGGMFNFVGNLASVTVPIVIGFLVKGDNFAPAITYIAATALLGAFCYGFMVGKVERIQETEHA